MRVIIFFFLLFPFCLYCTMRVPIYICIRTYVSWYAQISRKNKIIIYLLAWGECARGYITYLCYRSVQTRVWLCVILCQENWYLTHILFIVCLQMKFVTCGRFCGNCRIFTSFWWHCIYLTKLIGLNIRTIHFNGTHISIIVIIFVKNCCTIKLQF